MPPLQFLLNYLRDTIDFSQPLSIAFKLVDNQKQRECSAWPVEQKIFGFATNGFALLFGKKQPRSLSIARQNLINTTALPQTCVVANTIKFNQCQFFVLFSCTQIVKLPRAWNIKEVNVIFFNIPRANEINVDNNIERIQRLRHTNVVTIPC